MKIERAVDEVRGGPVLCKTRVPARLGLCKKAVRIKHSRAQSKKLVISLSVSTPPVIIFLPRRIDHQV